MASENTNEHPSIGSEGDVDDQIALEAGKMMASPPPGEEVVITGMAGNFPESNDVAHYRDNLLSKNSLITHDNRRWELANVDVPSGTGKVNDIEKFDAGFFGMHYRQTESLDPMCRKLLERSYEAMVDGGVNPSKLRGSRTGVYIGAAFSDTEPTLFYHKLESPSFVFTGCQRSMLANRISYFFGFNGPSHVLDTACSTSLTALEHAYRAIRTGRCDNALVGAVTLCLHPCINLQFTKLGALSKDCKCKCFDNDASGYVRSEAVVVVFLQKAKNARRIYAQIAHAKVNCDGFKDEGITFPSRFIQRKLFTEVYQECQIAPETVDFVEGHITGTKVGDPEELAAIDAVFCTNRKIPLPVGSVKSNIGHTEIASGLASLVKVLLCMEMDYILPNINYFKPREGVEALAKGRVAVVTDTIPWPKNGSGIAGVSNMGFGGVNSHAALKRFVKQKVNQGLPKDDIPRLVCVSGRTKEAVNYILDDISKRLLDAEFVRLWQEVFRSNIDGHVFRGYIIKSKTEEIFRSVKGYDEVKKRMCLVFSGPNYNWFNIAKELFTVPLFATSIQKIHDIIAPKGINIAEVIYNRNSLTNGIVSVIVGNVAIQIGLLHILKAVGLKYDYVIGYSTGELVAAYAEGSLTLEQTVIAAHAIGQCYRDLNKVPTTTCEVELDKNEILGVRENQLEVIGHNSVNNYTISGPSQNVWHYIDNLGIKGATAKEIQNNHGLHSKYSSQIRTILLSHLQQLIPDSKPRSSKWISSFLNKDQLNSEKAKYVSAEYFVECLLSPVLFYEATSTLPTDTVLLEIGAQIRNVAADHREITLFSPEKNSINHFLNSLGQMYEMGYNLKLDKLYPNVEWPVSVGTPMLSPLIKWNHDADWFVALYKSKDKEKFKTGDRLIKFSVKNSDLSYMAGHVVDGRTLIPATYFLVAVWETFSMSMGTLMTDTRVAFENVRFLRATSIPKSDHINLIVSIQKQTGLFEIAELGNSIVTGRIYKPESFHQETLNLSLPTEDQNGFLNTTGDIYKELKLRGYNFTGAFQGVKECNLSGSKGLVEWTGNWVAFIDNVLKVLLLQGDSRTLDVPISIERLTINPKEHMYYVGKFGENPSLPVHVYKELNIVRSGGIEAIGLELRAISRKQNKAPLLESHQFIPFQTILSLNQAIRINIQIVLENNNSMRCRAVEVIDSSTDPNTTPLSPIIYDALEDQPLIKSDIVVLSSQSVELANIAVENSTLEEENDTCSLVTVTNILSRPKFAKVVESALKRNGFVISREDPDLDVAVAEKNLKTLIVIAVQQTETEKLVLLRKPIEFNPTLVLNLTNCHENFDWLKAFQHVTANDKLLVFAHGDALHGILGLYYCIKSESSLNIKCFFVSDKNTPKFSINDDFYAKQLRKGLSVNVFKDGEWGTYRYLQLESDTRVQRQHIFNDVTVRGDLSSFRWIQGCLTKNVSLSPEEKLIHIYYSSLNFRDVMVTTGRITSDAIVQNRRRQMNGEGSEFAGRYSSGKRVMGMVSNGALATMVVADRRLTWEIPDNWTMEEAATVSVVYGTVIYGLITVARIKQGESILIHLGTGGVGQAAINVALHYKCNIFTTVGTREKKEWIRQKYPQIPESHVGNSRDTSFEQMIIKETQGRGVDVVLNALTEEKLLASVRCLAPNGRFLELGKYDLANNSLIGMKSFTDGRSFHGIALDRFHNASAEFKEHFHGLLKHGLKAGYVKPLNRTVFKKDEVEQAFRFMASGKHTGKILIKIRDEELDANVSPDVKLFSGSPRFYCHPNSCYIICGGLGGFGLELTDWLVKRGANKLVLTSRQGVKNGYQASRIRIWKSYGVTVVISTADMTTREGCIELIDESQKLGPIEAIFNLAMVLRDGLLENQTERNYRTVLGPKAVATRYLDSLTREMCPDLKHFVMFSSAVSRLKNAGQTSYGFANSIMERICEQRKKDGYPAQAIQWGAIGEVGFMAETLEKENDAEICGTLLQPISSCLDVMDNFLSQNDVVVSSIVVADKKGKSMDTSDMVETMKNIMGIADLRKISLHATLSELGMDSLMALEIKQTLEREYEQFLMPKDIRTMTFARLLEMSHEDENKIDEEDETDETKTPVKRIPSVTNGKLSVLDTVRASSLIEEKIR